MNQTWVKFYGNRSINIPIFDYTYFKWTDKTDKSVSTNKIINWYVNERILHNSHEHTRVKCGKECLHADLTPPLLQALANTTSTTGIVTEVENKADNHA